MDARMRRYAPQTSPERTKVWTEPPPKHPLQQQQQGRKVPVVYYLCRNRHLEHPHFIEVPLSSPEGLYLRDVIDRLNVLRGRKMAAMYSWSCKRSYKNGFVWHDLSEDDLILPAQGNEFVLKGSELLDQTPPDRNNNGTSNVKVQNPKHPLQDSPPVCFKGQEGSCSSSSATVVIKEAKLPLTSTMQPNPPPAMQEDELSPSTRRSGSSGNFSPEPCGRTAPSSALGSPDPADYRICKPIGAQDASTQTDDGGGRRTCGTNTRVVGVSTDDRPPHLEYSESQNEQTMCVKEETEIVKVERSPPPTFSSIPFSCGKMNTLESLIRDEVNKRNNFRVVEEEDVFLPTGPKFKATNMLMNVITCGSISVKDHYGFGFVPTYRPRFTDMKFSSPMFSNPIVLGEINCLPESQRGMGLKMKKKEYINGSMIEPNKYKEETGEGVADLKQSSLFDEDRSFNIPFMKKDKVFANVMVLWRGRNRSGLGSEDQDRSYRSQPQFEPNPPEFRTTTKARRSAMQLEAASSLPGVRADWDELRREARRIEGDLDVRLSSYAKLGVGYSDPKSPASDSHWKSMEMEIETLLARLTDVNEAMSRCAAAAVPTTSVAQKLTRHRDILHEFAQEFKRTRGNIMSMREHAELLTSVRNDINEYKTSSSSQAVPNLLRERAAIHGSITQIDEVTSQAEAIKGVLSAQRSTFGEIQGKVKQLSDRFPVIRNLLGMIKRKKSKDTIILSAVIAGCTLFLIIYSISK